MAGWPSATSVAEHGSMKAPCPFYVRQRGEVGRKKTPPAPDRSSIAVCFSCIGTPSLSIRCTAYPAPPSWVQALPADVLWTASRAICEIRDPRSPCQLKCTPAPWKQQDCRARSAAGTLCSRASENLLRVFRPKTQVDRYPTLRRRSPSVRFPRHPSKPAAIPRYFSGQPMRHLPTHCQCAQSNVIETAFLVISGRFEDSRAQVCPRKCTVPPEHT